MTTQLIDHATQQAGVYAHAATVREAAAMLGVSPATVRRECRRLGVTRVSGPTVAGFIAFARPAGPAVALSYAR